MRTFTKEETDKSYSDFAFCNGKVCAYFTREDIKQRLIEKGMTEEDYKEIKDAMEKLFMLFYKD